MGRKLRATSRTIRRRSGEAKAEVLALTGETGQLRDRSVKEARRLAAPASARPGAAARSPSSGGRRARRALTLREGRPADHPAARGEKITDRLDLFSGPDARPIRKGKLGKPYEFGYVVQLAELTPNTRRGARGPDPAGGHPGRHPRRERPAGETPPSSNGSDLTARGRAGWRLHHHRDDRAARVPRSRTRLHSAGASNPAPDAPNGRPAALPHRRRRTHQPPQTRLRHAPQPPERR